MKHSAAALYLVLLVAAPTVSFARTWGGGFGYFGPAICITDVDGLNQVFRRNGYNSEFSSIHWLMGGGGYALINRVIIGGSGAGGSQSIASNNTRSRLDIGGGHFEVGYMPLVLKHLFLGPALGIGGWNYTLTLEPTAGDVQNLDSLLAHPGRTSQASLSRLTITPELIVHVPISFVGVQLKAGYIFAPTGQEWTLAHGNKLLNGPEIASGTVFANVNVAFGGMDQERRRRKRD
jgi:hypothetical protein